MVGLILWLISIGFMLYSQGVMASAAREAARHVAIHGSQQVEEVIADCLKLTVPRAEDPIVEIQEGDTVTVTITCDYQPFVDFGAIYNLFGKNSSSDTTLAGKAHYRNERPPRG